MIKPIKRSKIRIWVGRIYYQIKKNIYWHFSNIKFAEVDEKTQLPFEVYAHKTPLLRKLKNVDMYLQYNKIDNLKIAIKKINNLVIEPGEIFSYWKLIGNPTQSKGYKKGMVLNDGGFGEGIGGGLCQLSNLLYWISIHSPLSIIERWRHVYDVFPDSNRTQPFGSGATCSYPAIDLQIGNNTEYRFQYKLWMDDEFLYGKLLCDSELKYRYEIFESDHKFIHEWWGGYTRNNKIFRKVIDKATDNVLENEFITENHAIMMYNPLLQN